MRGQSPCLPRNARPASAMDFFAAQSGGMRFNLAEERLQRERATSPPMVGEGCKPARHAVRPIQCERLCFCVRCRHECLAVPYGFAKFHELYGASLAPALASAAIRASRLATTRNRENQINIEAIRSWVALQSFNGGRDFFGHTPDGTPICNWASVRRRTLLS